MPKLSEIESLRESLGMDKFKHYKWENLCELINPDKFYAQVRSPEQLRSFMQALSFNFCIKNGCTPAPVSFSNDPNLQIAHTTQRNMPPGKSRIVVNKLYELMYGAMAKQNNTYYPYFLFELMFHESIHVWQIEATVNTLMLNKMPTDLQIAVLDQKLAELKLMAVASKQITENPTTDDIMDSAIMIGKVLFTAQKRAQNPLWDYSNAPSEITARDYSTKALIDVVNKFATDRYKFVLGEYIKDSNDQSYDLLTDPNYNNYNFFEELRYCQMFEDVREIVSPAELLETLVDGTLKRHKLPTFSDYLEATDTTALKEEIDNVIGDSMDIFINPEKYLKKLDELSEDFDAKCIEKQKEMDSNYSVLFPYTHQLKQGYEKPNPFLLADQAMFEQFREYLSNMQKNSR